jgi:hypothetical protein
MKLSLRIAHLVSILLLFVRAASAQNLAPNPSFENGVNAPTSWTLSSGKGQWEHFGRSGKRCVSATGDGENANSWQTPFAGEPGQTYLVRYWLMSKDATGGTPITGFNAVNRDVPAAPEWKRYAYVAALPKDTSDIALRFGQWHVKGTVFFDDVEVVKVTPVHARHGNLTLGSGEQIRGGRYTFRTNLGGFASNYARCLYEHTAAFNTDRWVLGGPASERDISSGRYVVYRHEVAGHPLTAATVRARVGYYESGECIVEASKDAAQWVEVGRINPKVNAALEAPVVSSLFPAVSLFVRIRSTGNLQVNAYGLEGTLSGYPPDMNGETYFFETQQTSNQLTARLLSVRGSGGRKALLLSLRNRTNTPRNLLISCETTSAKTQRSEVVATSLAPQSEKEVSITLPAAATGENTVRVSVTEARRKAMFFMASAQIAVPWLQDSSFGYMLASSSNCSLWWCEGTYKVSRERGLPQAKSKAVHIAAARNEYEPFQIVLRPKVPLKDVRVTVSPLQNPKSQIGAENIAISLVEYVPVTTPSDSFGSVGDYPDPLPLHEKPFDVAADVNQPLWVTVYVPKTAAAGVYRGWVRIEPKNAAAIAVPVALRVFDFTLPDDSHAKTAYGVHIDNDWHKLQTPEQFKQVWDLYMQNCRQHRISPYSPDAYARIKWELKGEQVSVDFTDFDKAMTRYLDEFRFNTFNLAILPDALGGHPRFTPEYNALYKKLMQPIIAHLKEKGWLAKAYCYWYDEPEESAYPYVIEGMKTLRQGAPGVRRLLTEQIETPLCGHVDLWVPIFHLYNHDHAKQRQALGEEVWWYVCTGPRAPYPNNFIDHPALHHRVRAWMGEKFGVDGELYWSATYYRREQGKLRNPWQDGMSISPDGYGWGNGDGMLLYPPVKEPPNAPVLKAPINSIRWELLREGQEDREYFYLLKNLLRNQGKKGSAIAQGKRAYEEAMALVKSLTEFERDPAKFYAARLKVAEAIERLK